MNLYLLTEVDCIIHTAGAAESVVIAYMMDGRAAWTPIPLGYLSIYLLIYLFLHPERPHKLKIGLRCNSAQKRLSVGQYGNGVKHSKVLKSSFECVPDVLMSVMMFVGGLRGRAVG